MQRFQTHAANPAVSVFPPSSYTSNSAPPHSASYPSSSSSANSYPLSKDKQGSSSSTFSLKSFDVYTKYDDEDKVQTTGGGLLSIIGWAIIAILVLGEVSNYVTPKIKEHMIVDTTLGKQLRINVNITFHALTCAEAHLDAMDVAGDNQLNVEHEMLKQRLSAEGIPIGKPGAEIIGEVEPLPEMPPDYCGSCYGAETPAHRCCNTCDELKAAYEERGWRFTNILKNSTQCLHDAKNPFAAVKAGEGCRITGSMKVNKVAGNFHIAHGESIVSDGRHIHQFIPAEAPHFNASHTIHMVSFGDPYPSMPPNPLDGIERIVDKDIGTGLFQYFIKIIPTIYTDETGRQLYTNQYTITERFRPLSIPNGHGGMIQQSVVLPGIFFTYELAPFLIEVKRTRMPFSHLFTKLCAIIGGVFTVLKVIDAIIFKVNKLFSRKGT